MKKCKLCDKPLPKSRISSEYCLPCDDKVNEWVRIQKATQGKDLKDKINEHKEQMLKDAQENFQEVVKAGEALIQEMSATGEHFFKNLRKQIFGGNKEKKIGYG